MGEGGGGEGGLSIGSLDTCTKVSAYVYSIWTMIVCVIEGENELLTFLASTTYVSKVYFLPFMW